MRAVLIALLAAVLGFATAGLLACGGETRGGIQATRAEDLKDQLQAVRDAVADGKCERANSELAKLRTEVEQVPPTVRRALRQRLNDGVDALAREVPDECEEAAKEIKTTTAPTTETVEPPPETAPPTQTQTQETAPPQTTQAVPPTTAPPTPQAPPTVPDGTGGISPDDVGGGQVDE